MTSFHVKPSRLSGEIAIPPSKSHTLRAILFALMSDGKSVIRNYLHSPDTQAMIAAAIQMGAKISVSDEMFEIVGVAGQLKPADDIIQAGNSGQVLRFIGALAALMPSYTVLTGDHSIRHNRPIQPLLSALTDLGAFAVSSRLDGYAPIIVRGPLKGHHAALPGEDSQPVSAMLIANAFLPHKTTLTVTNPGEKPWIDLTLHWLKGFGIDVRHKHYEHYEIPGGAKLKAFEKIIPGDFSSASYPIAAALITGSELSLKNIDMTDVQGDKKLIDALIKMGANITYERHTLTVKGGAPLKGMKIDINDYIDMITILPVIACFAVGKTEIVGAAIARKKESDRIRAICTELKKMGAHIEEKPDGLIVTPGPLKGAHMQSYNDHRMTLALTVAALGAQGESVIDGTQCVAKTYPTFKRDFQALGASIS